MNLSSPQDTAVNEKINAFVETLMQSPISRERNRVYLDAIRQCKRVLVDDAQEDLPPTLIQLFMAFDAFSETYDKQHNTEAIPPFFERSTMWDATIIDRMILTYMRLFDDPPKHDDAIETAESQLYALAQAFILELLKGETDLHTTLYNTLTEMVATKLRDQALIERFSLEYYTTLGAFTGFLRDSQDSGNVVPAVLNLELRKPFLMHNVLLDAFEEHLALK